jgi:hypothetical protein
MPERRPDSPPAEQPPERPDDTYSEEEEAEVRKRLEDLGYVE